MAKQVINNGETGLAVRTAINSNFTELYDNGLLIASTPPASGTWYNSNDGKLYQFDSTLSGGKWVSGLEQSFSFAKNGNINSGNYLFFNATSMGNKEGGCVMGYTIGGIDYGFVFEKISYWIKSPIATGFTTGTTFQVKTSPPDGSIKTTIETFTAPATGITAQADFTGQDIIPKGNFAAVRYINTEPTPLASSYVAVQLQGRTVYDA